jgi:hypothetical protein
MPFFFNPHQHRLYALLMQERMANNHVYVFRKSQPSKYAYVAECRCTGIEGWLTGVG